MMTPPEKPHAFGKGNNSLYWLVLPAGLFIGIGFGFLVDNFLTWMFIGFGVGFIAMFVVRLLEKK